MEKAHHVQVWVPLICFTGWHDCCRHLPLRQLIVDMLTQHTGDGYHDALMDFAQAPLPMKWLTIYGMGFFFFAQSRWEQHINTSIKTDTWFDISTCLCRDFFADLWGRLLSSVGPLIHSVCFLAERFDRNHEKLAMPHVVGDLGGHCVSVYCGPFNKWPFVE